MYTVCQCAYVCNAKNVNVLSDCIAPLRTLDVASNSRGTARCVNQENKTKTVLLGMGRCLSKMMLFSGLPSLRGDVSTNRFLQKPDGPDSCI